MSADYKRIHRLMQMIMLMQADEAGSADDLVERFGVDKRTVFRDVRLLKDIGIPCYYEQKAFSYRIERDFFLPPLHLSTSEALSLLILLEQIGMASQIALARPAAEAMAKIRAQLPAKIHDELEPLMRHISVRLPAAGPAIDEIASVYEKVRSAIGQRRALRCTYESVGSSGEGEAFIFRPYLLTYDQRAWYVIGHHEARGELRQLKLSRFTSLHATDESYVIPEDFSLEKYRGKAWRMVRSEPYGAEVEIAFEAGVADTVRKTYWHPTQRIEELADGSIRFRCEVDGFEEIIWWIMSYGPNAKVIRPEALATRIRDLSRAMVERYK